MSNHQQQRRRHSRELSMHQSPRVLEEGEVRQDNRKGTANGEELVEAEDEVPVAYTISEPDYALTTTTTTTEHSEMMCVVEMESEQTKKARPRMNHSLLQDSICAHNSSASPPSVKNVSTQVLPSYISQNCE